MEKPPYDQIIQDSTFGYTYNKILFDERGMPIDYVFLEVNPAYERMIGMEVGSVAGKRVTEVLPAIRTESFDWIECFARVAMTGERMEFEEYTHSLDRWFHLSLSSPSRGYFVGLSFDITERKKYEERLRKSEERNRLYVENAPDGIFITDKDLRYIDVNEAGCRMLGYTKEELLALEVKNVAVVQEEGYLDRYMGELFENGYIRRSGNLRKKDGSLIHVILDSISWRETRPFPSARTRRSSEA
jgi:PAS domain S-box-containing protein